MVRVYALGLSIFLAASTAFAQVSATTGAINGKVTDNSGGVLPGVTVTASSPSMQGVRTDVTNESGEYRFPAVAPGTYKVVYELPGFGTVNREGVNVGLGFTATLNIELGVASLQETVTVSGESKRWMTDIGPVSFPSANRDVFSRVSTAAPHTVIPALRRPS